MAVRRRRLGRAISMLVTTLAIVALVGLVAFGALAAARVGQDSGPKVSAADVAAQDQRMDNANKIAAARRARLAEARRRVRQQRAAVVRRGTYRFIPRQSPVLEAAGLSADSLCARMRRANRAGRTARERQRRQVLYYLNLSCPSH